MKNKKKYIKQERGITLIALVITIIVLLILAGVSIAMLTGQNGILTQVNSAKNETSKAGAKEKVQMEVLESYNNDGTLNIDKLKKNLKNNLGLTDGDITENEDGSITAVVEGYEITVESNGNVTVDGEETVVLPPVTEGETELSDIKGKYYGKDTLLTIDGKKVLIPAGATVSGIDSECKSLGIDSANKDEEGLVIYITNGVEITDWEVAKTQYDQFVWIPVETAYVTVDEIGGDSIDNLKTYITTNNKYPMAIKVNETDYKGILYSFKDNGTTILTITPYDYNTTSGFRETANLTKTYYTTPKYVYDSQEMFTAQNAGTWTETMYQKEFNIMVEKVAINGGFWVGRYETSNMNSSDFSTKEGAVKVVKGTREGIDNVTWYKMYEGQKEYKTVNIGNKSKTSSSMIWGSQWDQIMLWMKNVPAQLENNSTYEGKFYITNSIGMGNLGVDETGATTETKQVENTGYYGVKNIYDLAGNVYDWTLEAYGTTSRVVRRRRV